MTENDRLAAHLGDMLDAIEKATQFTEGVTYEEFSQDDKTLFALIRAIEVVGEAAKKIPPSIREFYPHIPWRAMTGMRDKLAHDYTSISQMVIWKTAREDLPALTPVLKALLAKIENAER